MVLYNGNGGTRYFGTVLPSGDGLVRNSLTTSSGTVFGVTVTVTVTDIGDTRYTVLNYPATTCRNGCLENGGFTNDPDGIALIAPDGSVREFLSYEGSFTATNGLASGHTSVDVGVSESGFDGASPILSLQRNIITGVWEGPRVNTKGGPNN